MSRKRRLTSSMTEAEFENGYWYLSELRDFAIRAGALSVSKLRKDELEAAIRQFIRTGKPAWPANRASARSAVPDVALGLRLDLPVVNYTSNKETKAFIEREAVRLQPGFKRASGTRYLLNRWREQQLSAGRRITYRDLVEQAIDLNKTKQGPLRIEHGRYMNFISDFMAANRGASHRQAVKAWHEVKAMDAPKTYESWVTARRKNR
jgi:SAP domain-containing new25